MSIPFIYVYLFLKEKLLGVYVYYSIWYQKKKKKGSWYDASFDNCIIENVDFLFFNF